MRTAQSTVEERPHAPLDYEALQDGEPALEVRASYHGVLLGTRYLSGKAPAFSWGGRRGLAANSSYIIGQSPRADAPAAVELLGGDDLPLVSAWGQGYLVSVTPGMTGDVEIRGKVLPLADYMNGRGSNFMLPGEGRAHIRCGAMSFGLDHSTQHRPMPKSWFRWRWEEQKFTVASILALGLFLLMIFFVPRDGVSVSGDLLGANNKLIPIVIVPPEPPKVPETLIKQPDGVQGNAGKAHPGKSGAMGDQKSKQARGAYAIQGKSKEPRLGQAEATLAAQSAGILGIFRAVQGSQFASILGSGSAVGDAQENILSTLQSADVANAYGIGGLGMRGSGSGGAGTNLPTLGDGLINTVGHNGYGRDPSVASLRRHITKTPTVTTGIVTTKGSLDKEIIRRVVHLHMNEVKYCFDQELVRKPELQGRVSVQFIISPLGQVIQSFLQSTTMNNARVETCVVSAIKRWEFPKPTGGGIAFVSYPFNFVAALEDDARNLSAIGK